MARQIPQLGGDGRESTGELLESSTAFAPRPPGQIHDVPHSEVVDTSVPYRPDRPSRHLVNKIPSPFALGDMQTLQQIFEGLPRGCQDSADIVDGGAHLRRLSKAHEISH